MNFRRYWISPGEIPWCYVLKRLLPDSGSLESSLSRCWGKKKNTIPGFLVLCSSLHTSAVCSHGVMKPAMAPSIVKMWKGHLILTISKVLKFVTGFCFPLEWRMAYNKVVPTQLTFQCALLTEKERKYSIIAATKSMEPPVPLGGLPSLWPSSVMVWWQRKLLGQTAFCPLQARLTPSNLRMELASLSSHCRNQSTSRSNFTEINIHDVLILKMRIRPLVSKKRVI